MTPKCKPDKPALYNTPQEAYRAYRESPEAFFESYHRNYFNERELISPDWSWYQTKYHYNLVENTIIDILRTHGPCITGGDVLDIGSGTGHWITFYLQYLEARSVHGVDFSIVSCDALKQDFANVPTVTIAQLDIAKHDPQYDRAFDIVNAIGILFHIVDDQAWASAIANILQYLKPDGIAIIGGDFGDQTVEKGVMRRFRSLALWDQTVGKLGGQRLGLHRFDWFGGGMNDGLKNNLLVFGRRPDIVQGEKPH